MTQRNEVLDLKSSSRRFESALGYLRFTSGKFPQNLNLCVSVERTRATNKRARDNRRQWYLSLMEDRACEICGEDDPITLDWHHLDPSEKEYSVAKMWKYRGKQAILEEIAKCQCLCANCHRKVHRDLRSQSVKPICSRNDASSSAAGS